MSFRGAKIRDQLQPAYRKEGPVKWRKMLLIIHVQLENVPLVAHSNN